MPPRLVMVLQLKRLAALAWARAVRGSGSIRPVSWRHNRFGRPVRAVHVPPPAGYSQRSTRQEMPSALALS